MVSKSLVIVESPAKAKTLSKFLGANYKIESCLGHVRDLPPKKLGVDLEKDFEPEYILVRGRTKTIKEIQKKAEKASKIFLAPDPDREGEAIAWHLAQLLENKENVYRITFDEVTKQAVTRAVKEPRRIDMNKVNAQQARRILDRIVGYKLSPFLWKKVGKGLSAGRVQSVTVRLICEREEQIKSFKPEEFWSITVKLKKLLTGKDFEVKLEKIDSRKAKIANEKTAQKIVKQLEKEKFFVEKVDKKNKKRNPLPPFTTSFLQQEASIKLYFTAKKTMRIAQQLYEGLDIDSEESAGLITYMRTDSVRISGLAQAQAAKYIKEKFGKEFAPAKAPEYRSKKRAQEAHEAIRPTDVWQDPQKLKSELSSDQYRLYQLIWSRFLASQMKPARLEITGADVEAGKFILRLTGSLIKFKGFLSVFPDKVEEEKVFPSLKEGEELKRLVIFPKQHFTKPPARFTEAGLVKALEEEGIGRPSTYVPIISTIQDRQYVEKLKGRFHPTELGEDVNKLLVAHFSEIMDIKFTANLEEKLDEVEEGKIDWVELMHEFYKPFSHALEKADKEAKKVKREDIPTDLNCPKCGAGLVIKRGRFGKFISCSTFPKCRHTQSLTLGIKCPEKDCIGEFVERKTRRKRTFFGCNQYPKCKFLSWEKPVDKKCPQCGALFLVEKKGKQEQIYHRCLNEECSHSEIFEEKEEV